MDASEEVAALAPSIMRIYFLGLAVVGLSVVTSYYLQASLKRGKASLISALRGIILPIFFALTLPLIFDYNAIWWAIPLSEFITAIIAALFLLTERSTKNASI